MVKGINGDAHGESGEEEEEDEEEGERPIDVAQAFTQPGLQ